jgi:MFS-type transporter involved in bile tolerance (Atg22 family)
VVAPEARAKGFIQQIDVIELESGKSKKTTVRASVTLSPAAYAETEGEYAIVITGHIVPPYISDRIDHRDPTDDEPTDITTRTSRLYVDISAIWLISAQRSVVLSKALHLSK